MYKKYILSDSTGKYKTFTLLVSDKFNLDFFRHIRIEPVRKFLSKLQTSTDLSLYTSHPSQRPSGGSPLSYGCPLWLGQVTCRDSRHFKFQISAIYVISQPLISPPLGGVHWLHQNPWGATTPKHGVYTTNLVDRSALGGSKVGLPLLSSPPLRLAQATRVLSGVSFPQPWMLQDPGFLFLGSPQNHTTNAS